MRLICPSCRAQYEVDDDAIPAEGRDVQCGSCSTTWFQEHALSLTGAGPAPLAENTAPVFRHQDGRSPANDGLPAPQPMPDDTAADREKLLREIRAEAEQDIKAVPTSRIERAPLPRDDERAGQETAFVSAPSSDLPAVPEKAAPKETALDTDDVHSYPAAEAIEKAGEPMPDGRISEAAFMQNLRSQIEEQERQPNTFTSARSSSVITAAERAGISLDPAKIAPPSDGSRTESLQRTLRDLGSTPQTEPRRRSYSVGVYSAAVLFLVALATYLLRSEITSFYPAAAPWLEGYAGFVDSLRLLIQDLWAYVRDWVSGLMGSDAPAS